jgi:PAS domain S-box-containing protein
MNGKNQKTILLVDDEAIIAASEKITLEKYGYLVLISHTGEEAVALAAKTPAIDLVLMDINLGAGIDGTKAAEMILKDREIPVVFLSSHMEPEVVAKTERITSYGYVVKNSTMTVLDASIKMALKLFNAKKALWQNEDRYRRLYECMPLGYQSLDADGRFVEANQAWLDMLGYSRDQVIGHWFGEFLPTSDQDLFRERFPRFKEIGEVHNEFSMVRGDGSSINVHFDGRIGYDDQHRFKQTHCIISNITERTRAEVKRDEVIAELKKSEARAQALLHTIPDMLFRVNREGLFLDFKADAKDLYAQSDANIIGKRCRDILPAEFADLIDLKTRATLETGTLQTFEYQLPIPAQGVRDYEARMVASGADEVTAIVRDITERKSLESQREAAVAAQRESEKRLRDIIVSMADWVWEVDEKGVYTYSSDMGVEFFGASRGDIVGKTPFDFMPPEEAKRVGMIFSEIVANKSVIKDLENWNVGRNGERICLLTNGVPILDEQGNLKGYRGVDKDITARKRAEEIIKNTVLFQQVLMDAVPSPIFYKDAAGVYIGGNKAFEQYLGLTREQFIGKTVHDIAPKDLAEKYEQADNELLKNGGVQTYEASVVYADGKRREVVFNKATFTNAEGCLAGLIGVILDISDRKRALEALSESVDKFKGYFNMGTVGICVTSLEKGWIEVNDFLCRMLGYSREDLLRLTWAEMTHPDDLNADLDLFNQLLAGRRDSYELEKRFIRQDGQIIYTLLYVTCQRNPDGTVHHLLASLVDITTRKQAEEALRRSEATQSAALQMTKAGHWEYDVDKDLFTFNDNFYRIFQITADAVGGYQMSSGEYARRFLHPDDMAKVGSETRAAIETSDPNYSRQIEHRILYADGRVGWIAVRFFIVKDAQGRTIKTFGVNQDISERKWGEEEVKRQLAEKGMLLKEVHHRIKNNFASVAGLLSLRMHSVANPEAVAVLKDAVGRIDSMRVLYDKLLLSEGYQEISVKHYVESLAAAVVSLFPEQARVKLDLHITDFNLDPKKLFPLGIIINELLTNIMKYAFSSGGKGTITISLVHTADQATLALRDNGRGLPENFDLNASKGFGLTLVKMLSQQLGGSFTVEKHKGTRCTLTFAV